MMFYACQHGKKNCQNIIKASKLTKEETKTLEDVRLKFVNADPAEGTFFETLARLSEEYKKLTFIQEKILENEEILSQRWEIPAPVINPLEGKSIVNSKVTDIISRYEKKEVAAPPNNDTVIA